MQCTDSSATWQRHRCINHNYTIAVTLYSDAAAAFAPTCCLLQMQPFPASSCCSCWYLAAAAAACMPLIRRRSCAAAAIACLSFPAQPDTRAETTPVCSSSCCRLPRWTALADTGHLECTAAAAMAALRIDDIEAVEPESFLRLI